MILEGFEIENWTCIKKLVVSDLPATGVIVFHARNRTGKSNLVRALRACLMDFPSGSTSSKLKAFYPRGTAEKPTVSVTFKVGGVTYRITKNFGSTRSELASRTLTGDWRVEASTAADAHSRVCELVDGDDAGKGLRQLLWLTQAEFKLPDAKKFDSNVQAQLRGILGVLQTPLDDRFMDRVRKSWNEWYSGQRRVGKQHQIKDGCPLSQKLDSLAEAREELENCETRFRELEDQLRQTNELETRRFDLDRQLAEQTRQLRQCQDERDRSQVRIAARKLAEDRYSQAEKEHREAIAEQKQRVDAAQRLTQAQSALAPAKSKVDSLKQAIEPLADKQRQRKAVLGERRDEQRGLQQRANRIAAELRAMDDADKLKTAQADLNRGKELAQTVASIKSYLEENPIPDQEQQDELKNTQQRILQLQADRDAASMVLRIIPAEGAAPAELALDGGPVRPLANDPTTCSVRRRAELHIPVWGRVELSRGTGSGDIDEIEAELQQCHEAFGTALAPFGIAASEPDSFEQLLRRVAEHGLKKAELQKQAQEFKKFASGGIEPLQRRVRELEAKLRDIAATEPEDTEAMSGERDGLEALQADLGGKIDLLDSQIASLDEEVKRVDADLEQRFADVTSAKEELAGLEATADSRQEELERLRTEEQIASRVKHAGDDLLTAKAELERSELTAEESTVKERLTAYKEAVNAIDKQIRENDEKYNRIKGRLEGSEGLHAQRALLAARVDALVHVTERMTLEKDAVDRLYELFEDCREKQLSTLMGPIHDRVLSWMHVLEIGDYKELRFSDAFLPDKLVRRDGTAEFDIDEESTGAQEQIGMLVRVALGSILTSPDEPTVAILDDPLTHCDVGRLNKMRVILRRAAEGDSKLSPPAGPLQIIVLTCHPEWFRDERATVIDLENLDFMHRFNG